MGDDFNFFCRVMGFATSREDADLSWKKINAALEFSAFMGLRAILREEDGEKTERMRLSNGVLLRIYKAKRYTLWGRVKTLTLKIIWAIIIGTAWAYDWLTDKLRG